MSDLHTRYEYDIRDTDSFSRSASEYHHTRDVSFGTNQVARENRFKTRKIRSEQHGIQKDSDRQDRFEQNANLLPLAACGLLNSLCASKFPWKYFIRVALLDRSISHQDDPVRYSQCLITQVHGLTAVAVAAGAL